MEHSIEEITQQIEPWWKINISGIAKICPEFMILLFTHFLLQAPIWSIGVVEVYSLQCGKELVCHCMLLWVVKAIGGKLKRCWHNLVHCVQICVWRDYPIGVRKLFLGEHWVLRKDSINLRNPKIWKRRGHCHHDLRSKPYPKPQMNLKFIQWEA